MTTSLPSARPCTKWRLARPGDVAATSQGPGARTQGSQVAAEEAPGNAMVLALVAHAVGWRRAQGALDLYASAIEAHRAAAAALRLFAALLEGGQAEERCASWHARSGAARLPSVSARSAATRCSGSAAAASRAGGSLSAARKRAGAIEQLQIGLRARGGIYFQLSAPRHGSRCAHWMQPTGAAPVSPSGSGPSRRRRIAVIRCHAACRACGAGRPVFRITCIPHRKHKT